MTSPQNRSTAEVVSDSKTRGARIIKLSLTLKNLKSTTIATEIAWLLDSGLWRSYTLPNGETFDWGSSEFDYFLQAHEFDLRLIEQSIRATGDRMLITRWLRATSGKLPERRRINQVLAAFPSLQGRVYDSALPADALRAMARSDGALKRFIEGKSPSNSRDAREWLTIGWPQGSTVEERASRIVRRVIAADSDLAKEVLKELQSKLNQSS